MLTLEVLTCIVSADDVTREDREMEENRECYVCKREVGACEGMVETFIGDICVDCDARVRG